MKLEPRTAMELVEIWESLPKVEDFKAELDTHKKMLPKVLGK